MSNRIISLKEHLQNKLQYPLNLLVDIAYNFWWSWSGSQSSLFRDIDPELWEKYCHNPIKLLNSVSENRLTQLATSPYYCDRVLDVAAQLKQYLEEAQNLSQFSHQLSLEKPIAYFSIEFGVYHCLPTYSGGLGILAADHLKSASDLGLPIVGVSLIYRHGYFQQRLSSDGWQEEILKDHDLNELPLTLCTMESGEPIIVKIEIENRLVQAQVWLAKVGRVSLYLLDTDRDDNEPSDRTIADQLYGGSRETRLAQEYLLGIGGVRLLHQLGLNPTVYHLNEGHAAFALLEVARMETERTGKALEDVKEEVRSRCVFTTHTPVPAGHDTFTSEQIKRYFSRYWVQLKLEEGAFLDLGRKQPGNVKDPFNMTVLALRLCRAANGVSKLNGQVCREMWAELYPNLSVEKVPIGNITNGVHARTWVAPLMAELYDKYLDKNWSDRLEKSLWEKIEEIPDEELWSHHQRLKERLIAYTRFQIQKVRGDRHQEQPSIEAATHLLDSNALTIGFARRFSTYKRGNLIIHDRERAKQIFSNSSRPVQIIFAGKAHPADDESKQIIQELIAWSHDAKIQNRVAFIENYDMHIAQKLVQGVDIWLNNPIRPQEASGTSGQKASFNGALNCSILDGWWYEAYQEGINGWAINSNNESENCNQNDAEALYKLLEEDIIPCYYDRSDSGLPHRWIAMMKAAIKTIGPQFNTNRMVKEYVTQMYLPLELDTEIQ